MKILRPLLVSLLLFSGLAAQTSSAETLGNPGADSDQTKTVQEASPYSSPSRVSSGRANGISFQLGGFLASQGIEQDVGVDGMIGDHYSVGSHSGGSFLLGLGYYFEGAKNDSYQMVYGINAFYFAPKDVQGGILQEKTFSNLSYRYSISNFPVYLATKGLLNSEICDVTVDFGMGVNFIKIGNYSESSSDNGVTAPNNSFSGGTRAAFSVMAGAGLRFSNVIGTMPLEVGYRFFYFGKSHLDQTSSEITNALETGNIYAHALMISALF